MKKQKHNNHTHDEEKQLGKLMNTMREILEQEESCELGLIMLSTKQGNYKISFTDEDILKNLTLLAEGFLAIIKEADG